MAITVVSWNINKRTKPWEELLEMEADVALLQETGLVPSEVADSVEVCAHAPWKEHLYDRFPRVVKLSDKVTVEWFKQVAPVYEIAQDEIAVSGIGTIAAAKVIPQDDTRPFIAVSMYARWIYPHPSANSKWSTGYSDGSAHRIISDLSAFIGHTDPSTHRILAAGDLNMIYGATDDNWLALPARERTVWTRMEALGLEFMGPQYPDAARQAVPIPSGLPEDTKNVPTFYNPGRTPEGAQNQLDYVFASRGFHENVKVRALNDVENWGSSDHCRLLITVE